MSQPRRQHPKRSLSEFKPRELRHIVSEIQKALWQVEFAGDKQCSTGRGVHHYWNADKEWDCPSLLSEIATVLEDYGLKPIDPPIIQGLDSVDQFLEALPKNTPPEEQPFPEIDRSDSEDPDYWQGQPGGNPPTS